MTRDTAILLALLALASPAALAGEPSSASSENTEPNSEHTMSDDEKGKTFSEWDLNNDGQLEENEVLNAQVADEAPHWGGVNFFDLDQNGDSVVTREEWQEHFQS